MSEQTPDLSTDSAWEEWGRCDPYFAVVTDPRFRRAAITEEAKREFFETGRTHIEFIVRTIHRYVDATFAPNAALDFGCGVGRILIPLARIAAQVVGSDVSPTMLQEARRNCDEHQLTNVSLLSSDDALSSLKQTFDLIHSFIVFQHIPRERGRTIFRNLLTRLNPGGIAAVHFSYSKSDYAPTHGIAPATASSGAAPLAPDSLATDPEMQMNPYNVNELLFLMQEAGVQRFHVEFTDHGGELGILLFFATEKSA